MHAVIRSFEFIYRQFFSLFSVLPILSPTLSILSMFCYICTSFGPLSWLAFSCIVLCVYSGFQIIRFVSLPKFCVCAIKRIVWIKMQCKTIITINWYDSRRSIVFGIIVPHTEHKWPLFTQNNFQINLFNESTTKRVVHYL